MSITPIEPSARATYNLGINATQLGIGRHADKFSIKNIYIDVDDAHIKVAPFDFTDDVDDNGSVLALPATTIGSAYQIQFYAAGKMLLSAYFEMPERDCFLAELKLYTAMPAREQYPEGAPGKSAYQSAIDTGVFEGTEEQWAQWQKPTINDVDLLSDIKVINDVATMPAGVLVPRRIGSDVYSLSTFNDRLAGMDKILTQTGGTVDIAGVPVKTLKQAADDALNIATAPIYDFVDAGKDEIIERPLGPSFKPLSHYLEYLDAIKSVFTQSSGDVTINGVARKSLQQAMVEINNATALAGQAASNVMAQVNAAINEAAISNSIIPTADLIKIAPSGGRVARNQKSKNDEAVTPFDFGLIGDGLYHALSERFTTLDSAKAQYSHATALTDSIDWCALQAFFNYCHEVRVVNANASCKAYINKPIEFRAQQHATSLMYGNLELITDDPLNFMLGMAGLRFIFLGNIKFSGKSANTPTGLVTKCGLLLGDLVQGPSLGSGANMYIHAVEGESLTDCLVHWGNNTHFSAIGQVRGIRIGSGMMQNDYLSHSALFTGATHVTGDINQKSILPVSTLPPVAITTAPVSCTINGQLYAVTNIDRAQSIIEIYPRLPKTTLSGTLYYHYGCVVRTIGNDTSNLRINTLQAIQSGLGVAVQSLYGLSVGTFSSEALGVATYIGSKGNATVGNNINSGYFETNTWDVAYGWNSGSNPLPINTTIALNPAKVVSLADYRLDHNDEMANGLFARAGLGDIEFEGVIHNSGTNDIKGELTHPEKYVLVTSGGNINLSFNKEMYRLFGKRATTFVLVPVLGALAFDITFNAPVGGTVNGAANVPVTAADYNSAITVTVYAVSETEFNLTIHSRRAAKKGTTDQRPIAPETGQRYYDTTILASGKPIEWNGSSWVDALGVVV